MNFLENISIRKSYPSTLIIRANQTNIIAITYFNEKKYYVGSNGKFISTEFFPEFKKLPIIFGQFKTPDFISLQKNLKILNMDKSKIAKYYFHKNKLCFYFLIEASSKIFFIKFLKVMLLNFAISGTSDKDVMPG